VLDLSSFDLEEIGNVLADQTDYEHRWLVNPQTAEIAFRNADTGIDGQTTVDLDELDLVCIHPLPSWVWYQDMADFAGTITDERAGRLMSPRNEDFMPSPARPEAWPVQAGRMATLYLRQFSSRVTRVRSSHWA
jgi:hypothetical protein